MYITCLLTFQLFMSDGISMEHLPEIIEIKYNFISIIPINSFVVKIFWYFRILNN